MESEGQVSLSLQPQQSLAFQCPAKELVYGGAAGGGKSHFLRAAGITWATQVPGLQLGLFRRAYPDLITNHLEGPTSFWELLAPWIQTGHVRISMSRARIYFWNGSTIRLCHLNTKKDLAKYQGAEFHVLLFDELTHFTEAEYRYLRGRLRMTGLNAPDNIKHLFPRIASGTNPGSIGHVWVKRGFVNKGGYNLHKAEKKDGGMLRCYIPAKLADNPALAEGDPEYEDRLEGLGDPLLVRAMKEGDWNIVADSMFGEQWRHEIHTCDPFAIPPDWQIWRGGDDGFTNPTAVAWLTQDPATKTYYVIDEVYKAGMVPDVVADRVLKTDHEIPRILPDGTYYNNDTHLAGFYDSSAFSDGGADTETRGDQMNARGLAWEKVEKWPGSRAERAKNLHRLLKPNKNDPQGGPGIRFFRGKCKTCIELIPTLPRDDKDLEAVSKNSEDHIYDAVTYGLQWKIGRVGKVKASGF